MAESCSTYRNVFDVQLYAGCNRFRDKNFVKRKKQQMEEGLLAKRGLHNNLKATIGRHGWVILLSKKLGAFRLQVGGRWVAAISSASNLSNKVGTAHACSLACWRIEIFAADIFWLKRATTYLMAGNQKKDPRTIWTWKSWTYNSRISAFQQLNGSTISFVWNRFNALQCVNF